MSLSDNQLRELEEAYRVLGVPREATTHSIKQAYRRLVKRWHPDLYENGSPSHVEATQMVKLINEAYSAIAHAPLRYHIEGYSQEAERRSAQASEHSTRAPVSASTEYLPKTDRFEFWLRFVCGAVAGIFVSLDLAIPAMPERSPRLSLLGLGALGITLAFGFGAARFGDKFWHSILRRWWLWP